MMKNTSRYLVPIVLGAVGVGVVCLLCFRGCGKGGESDNAAAQAALAEARKAELDAKMRESYERRIEIAQVREVIAEQMRKMVDAMREKMPGASDDEVLAALEKEQEWRSLRRRIVDLETANADNRRRTGEVLREYKDVAAPTPEKSPADGDGGEGK